MNKTTASNLAKLALAVADYENAWRDRYQTTLAGNYSPSDPARLAADERMTTAYAEADKLVKLIPDGGCIYKALVMTAAATRPTGTEHVHRHGAEFILEGMEGI